MITHDALKPHGNYVGIIILNLEDQMDWFPTASCHKQMYNSKQVLTGLEGNRQIYLPREIQDRLPKGFY